MATSQQAMCDDPVQCAAQDYTDMLKGVMNCGDNSKEDAMIESFDSVLTRLDEFYGMMDMVRSDSTQVTDQILHRFRAQRDKLRLLYDGIDDLEKFIELVKSDSLSMEKHLNDTAANYSVLNSIKKAFSSLRGAFGNVNEKREKISKPNVPPPTVFRTLDYIPSKTSQTSPNDESGDE